MQEGGRNGTTVAILHLGSPVLPLFLAGALKPRNSHSVPGARHSRHQVALPCPGSRGRASLGADAVSPTDASPHPAPSRLHLSTGQGRQTAKKSRSSAHWVQHLWSIFNGSGPGGLGRPDQTTSTAPPLYTGRNISLDFFRHPA